MATVTGMTAEAMMAIRDGTIVSAAFDSANHLVLTKYDGTQVDGGSLSGATTTMAGPVELATNAETQSGSATNLAVTPAGLASLPGYRVQVLPYNSLSESATPASWPYGVALMGVNTGSGWTLNGGFGTVVTSSVDSDRTEQTFYSNSGGATPPKAWVRTYTSALGWTPWSQVILMVNLTAGSFSQTTAFTAYPLGQSRLYYTAVNSSAWDFTGKAGEVITYSDGVDYARQTFTQHVGGSSASTAVWVRTANAANGWSPWKVTVFNDRVSKLPTAMASGQISIATTSADVVASDVVTFPAGRFTDVPIVQVTPNTTVPGSQVTGVGVSGVTATGCTIYVDRHNTTPTNLNWLAVQM